MSELATIYRAYLLRLWTDGDPPHGDPPRRWRCSLEDTRTRARRGFASLEEMAAFLDQEDGQPGQHLPAGGGLPDQTLIDKEK